MVSMNELKQDMITGMGYIGLDSGRLYRMRRGPKLIEAVVFGTTVIINDAAEGRPFRGLRVFGRTEQVRTTGAQLLDLSDKIGKTQTKNGVTYIINDDQSITVSGKTGDYTSFYIKDMALKAGTYFLKNESRDKNKKIFIQLIGDRIKEGVFTLDKDVSSIGVYFVFNVFGGTVNIFNDTVTTMLNEGSTALPWEPYTGGKPSPSPEYPQEIVSAGESGTINVSISDSGSQSQSLTLATPNGLPGVPVSKDGNYTDADGQQWVCDEIDLGRGKYVQRIEEHILKSKNIISITNSRQINSEYYGVEYNGCTKDFVGKFGNGVLCDKLAFVKPNSNINGHEITYAPGNGIIVFGLKKSLVPSGDLDEIRNYITSNNFAFLILIDSPIEKDLTPEEITEYKKTHTNYPTTVITNDAGAHMEVSYVADRKEN